MSQKDIIQQLELYSNAIIAFIVIQGLGFCYTFGSNDTFNGIISHEVSFAIGLLAMFIIILLLALYANKFIGKKLVELNSDYAPLVRKIYFGKAIIILMFGIMPCVILLLYAIL